MYTEIDINSNILTLSNTLLERLDILKSRGVLIQSQPLGFMRLALDGQDNNQEGYFLHVWIPGLPTQSGGPFRHTHVFDLTSRVLLGDIQDTTYKPISDINGKYELIGATCAQDYCLPFRDAQERVNLEVINKRNIKTGEIYMVPKGSFHDTTVLGNGISVTLIKKTNVENKDPILVVPVDVNIPQEVFRRDQIDQDIAWNKIRELLNSVKTEKN